jgi:preprotein translocase subunit SecG
MKKLYLHPSFFPMNRREEGREGKVQVKKKIRKIVVFLFTFCLLFLSFLNKEGQKIGNKAKKGFEKKKG